MKTLRLLEQEKIQLLPGITFHAFAGEKLMLNHLVLEKGAVAPLHAHPHEQITIVLRGEMDFTLGEERTVLKAGDIVAIPSEIQHSGVALLETELLEVFTPVREDLMEKLRS